jgi:hypothetical protein
MGFTVLAAMDVKFIALCRVTSCMVKRINVPGKPQCRVLQNIPEFEADIYNGC